MRDKYYTPDIEDLFIGYECEYTSDMSVFKCEIQDCIIKGKLCASELTDIIKWVTEDGDDLSLFVRTKYLNKDDLIADGWKESVGKNNLFTKHESCVLHLLEDHWVIILKYEEEYFSGEIKSINELRKLEKWLKLAQ